MTLGLARLDAADVSTCAARLDTARAELTLALAELRDLVRGLDPATLADGGLPAAIEERARRSPVPVDVDLSIPEDLPPAIAATAYFVLTEALTNLIRRSDAATAAIRGTRHAEQLVLEVRDDGRGGADPTAGTGLSGLAERVTLSGGRLRLSSPVRRYAEGAAREMRAAPCVRVACSGCCLRAGIDTSGMAQHHPCKGAGYGCQRAQHRPAASDHGAQAQ